MSSAETSVDLGDFLSTAVHTVLWRRRVYPRETFERTIRWGTVVWRSMHKGLCEYIETHIRDAEAWLLKGKLQELQIVLNEPQEAVPVERFRFRFKTSGNLHLEVLTADSCRCFFEKLMCKDFRRQPNRLSFTLLLVCHDIEPQSYTATWIREASNALRSPGEVVQEIDPILSVPVSQGLELEALVHSFTTRPDSSPEFGNSQASLSSGDGVESGPASLIKPKRQSQYNEVELSHMEKVNKELLRISGESQLRNEVLEPRYSLHSSDLSRLSQTSPPKDASERDNPPRTAVGEDLDGAAPLSQIGNQDDRGVQVITGELGLVNEDEQQQQRHGLGARQLDLEYERNDNKHLPTNSPHQQPRQELVETHRLEAEDDEDEHEHGFRHEEEEFDYSPLE